MDIHPALDVARTQWRDAEERLLPVLITEPTAAARAIEVIGRLLVVLRNRGDDPAALLAAASDADALVAALALPPVDVPAELLAGVACGVRLREIAARQDERRVEQLVARGLETGATWVVLAGPEDPGRVAEGRVVMVHVASRTVLTATADPGAADGPYELQVRPHLGNPLARRFCDRAEWLDEFRLCRCDVEALHGGRAPRPAATPVATATRTGAR
ncbi:hypothetical protein [Pseudonocardia dioxanivorans]|uniref:hypothetical protein n=1 Tax=Pseudonocardia dioxanivorans TaxID=240495 RepID=UPI000CD2FA3C|nr:hypothetical protein [Pseudonocardia dioxanivorans]